MARAAVVVELPCGWHRKRETPAVVADFARYINHDLAAGDLAAVKRWAEVIVHLVDEEEARAKQPARPLATVHKLAPRRRRRATRKGAA